MLLMTDSVYHYDIARNVVTFITIYMVHVTVPCVLTNDGDRGTAKMTVPRFVTMCGIEDNHRTSVSTCHTQIVSGVLVTQH